MQKNKGEQDRGPLALLTCLCILLFFLVLYVTVLSPLCPDEITNSFVIEASYDKVYTSSSLISSLGDVLHNASVVYSQWTGRFTSNFLVYFYRLCPEIVFHVMNAAVFVGILLMVRTLAALAAGRDAWRVTLGDSAVVALAAMLLMQLGYFSEIFVWETGSIVYSHMLLLSLVFFALYLHRQMRESSRLDRGWGWWVALFLLGLVCGGTQENLSPTLFAGCFLLWAAGLWRNRHNGAWKQQAFSWQAAGLLGLFIGTCLMILSPGNSVRSEAAGLQALLAKITSGEIFTFIKSASLGFFFESKPLLITIGLLALVLLAAGLAKKSVPADKATLWVLLLLFLMAILSMLLLYFAPFYPLRSYCFPAVFFIIMTAVLLYELFSALSQGSAVLAGVALGVSALVFAGPYLNCAAQYKQLAAYSDAQTAFLEQAVQRGEGVISLAPATRPSTPAAFFLDIQPDSNSWVNRVYANYYGADLVLYGETMAATAFMPRKDRTFLQGSHVFIEDKNVTLLNAYYMPFEGHIVLRLVFDGGLDLTALYARQMAFNLIALNVHYLDANEEEQVLWKSITPTYQRVDDTWVVTTEIEMPEEGEDVRLYINVFDPDTERYSSAPLWIEVSSHSELLQSVHKDEVT